MARLDSLSIQLQTNAEYKDKLAESYGKVIENLQKSTISSALKNTDLSGDVNSGTVEAKRFANATAQNYGTARGNGYANKVKALPVVVALDTNKEFIEEVEEKDLKTYGVGGLIERRTANQGGAMKRLLERAFFNEAVTSGSALSLSAVTAPTKLEEAIQNIETTKNDFVDGVERDLISVVCAPSFYGDLRNYLDAGVNNANVTTEVGEFGRFHGVDVYSSVYLPAGVDFVIMVNGSIAQPVLPSIYNPSKIELSDATAFGLFLYYGTKAVTPELIKYEGTPSI
jgi:hypothetical protein